MSIFQHKNLIQSRGIAAAILLLVISVLPVPIHLAQAENLQEYLLQLNDQDIHIINLANHTFTRRFQDAQDSRFANWFTVKLNEAEAARLSKIPGITIIKPFKVKITAETYMVNDPGFTLNGQDIDRQWGLAKARFPESWLKTQGDNRIKVAIVDTGIDQTHEDFFGTTFLPGFNVLTKTPILPGSNSDDNGHGTLVAGVLAAVKNNRIGVAGVAAPVSVIPIKALSDKGEGTSTNVAEAIVWATNSGAHIINLSMGGVGFAHDKTLADSISYAYSRNVVIVAAAGNDAAETGGSLDKEPVFPICDDNGANMVLGVAATDQNDLKAVFSNYGKACVDVSAPGRRILSTINYDPITGKASPNSYAYASGTSMAAPYVSGLAALLKALNPQASNTQIRDRIITSTDPVDSLNLVQCNNQSCAGLIGSGRINAQKAVLEPIKEELVKEGDYVFVESTNSYYLISGGKKQPISQFVAEQRYSDKVPKGVVEQDLLKYPVGTYAAPKDGTLVKAPQSAAVYYIYKSVKLPVTAEVFALYGFRFTQVVTLPEAEVGSWVTASLLIPPEGSLVKTSGSQTVYWAVDGALHPISYNFYTSRGLHIFPLVYLPASQIANMPLGESYF